MEHSIHVIIMGLVCSGQTLAAGGAPESQSAPRSAIPMHGMITTSKVEIAEPPDSLRAGPAGNMLRLLEINREVTTDEEIVFDNARALWRFSAKDTRDPELLKAQMSLTDEELKGASRTQIVLGGLDGRRGITYFPERALAHLWQAPPGQTGRREIPFDFGMVNASILTAPETIAEDTTCDGETCKKITRHGKSGSDTVVLDPRAKNRFREKITSTPEGVVVSKSIAGDYRQIGGYWIPFHFEEHQWSAETGRLQRSRIVNVRSVNIKEPISPETFSIRLLAGTSVIDDINGSAFRLGEAMDVTLESAPHLRSLAKRSGRTDTGPSQ